MATKKKVSAPVRQPLPSDDKVLSAADQLKVMDVLTSVATARAKLEDLLSQVSSEALSQLNTYEVLNRAIEIKQAELKTLHGKEEVLKSIDDLKALVEETKARWATEKSAHEQHRQAEGTEWRFRFEETKKEEEAKYRNELRLRKQSEAEEAYQKEQAWKRREEALLSQEAELAELRLMAQGYDEKVKKEFDAKTAQAVGAVKKDFDHEKAMMNVQFQSQLLQLNDRLKLQDGMLSSKDKEITELRQQIAKSEERAAETVRAALDSASGRAAMDKVQETLSNTQSGMKR